MAERDVIDGRGDALDAVRWLGGSRGRLREHRDGEDEGGEHGLAWFGCVAIVYAMAKKKKEWAEAHRREARIATRRLADDADLAGNPALAMALTSIANTATGAQISTDSKWRERLRLVGLTDARIEREVRRVRAFAEGRLVRETEWIIVSGSRARRSFNDTLEEARTELWAWRATDDGAHIVRVTRIRRAP